MALTQGQRIAILLGAAVLIIGIIIFAVTQNNQSSPCVRSCPVDYCGSDGCGGLCGCEEGFICDSTTSQCVPKFDVVCSDARGGGSYVGTSGCPDQMSRPWVACEDDTGKYLCWGLNTLIDAQNYYQRDNPDDTVCAEVCPHGTAYLVDDSMLRGDGNYCFNPENC